MRKFKLLFVTAAAMLGLNASAQLTDGTVYWLQDAATGQFLSQGDAWGTKAVTQDVGGLGFEVIAGEGVYQLKNVMLNTVHGKNSGLGVDQYVDQSPADYTISATDNGYTVSLNGKYLVNNGAMNDYKEKPIVTTDIASEATVWKFLTKTEYDAAIQEYKDKKAAGYAESLGKTATTVAALETVLSTDFITKDYTTSINNPTLGSNFDGWAHGKTSQRGEGNKSGNGCSEFWNGCGYAKQTISGLPNGLYKVTFVGTYRPANLDKAGDLISEKASSPAFVYANDAEIEFLHWIDVPKRANGRSDITTANGYGHTFYTYVTDGTLAIGVVADGWTPKDNNNSYCWCPFGQFTLTYYTDQVTDEAIAELVATIPAEETIPAEVASNLANLKTLLQSNKSAKDFNALSAAIKDANELAGLYASYKELVAEIPTLEYADPEINNSLVEMQTQVPLTANDAKNLIAEFTNKLRAYYESNALAEGKENVQDITSRIVNPNAEDGTNGWTLVGRANVKNNESLTDASGKDTYKYFDSDQWGDNAWDISLSQDISLPKGKYLLTVASRAAAGLTSFKLFANPVQAEMARKVVSSEETVTGNEIEMKHIGASGGVFNNGWNDATLAFELDEDAVVNIGVQGVTDQVHQWMSFTRFRMVQLDAPAAGKIKDLEEKLEEAMTVITDNPSAEEQLLFDLVVAYNDGLEVLNSYKKGAEVSYDDVAAAIQALDDAIKNITTTTGISTVSTVQDGSTIYNLGGQKVNNLRKGVYIINGKKVVK